MTNPNASLEGSILTPKGWVKGRVVLDGPIVKAVEGRALPRAPGRRALHRPRLYRSSCARRGRVRLDER